MTLFYSLDLIGTFAFAISGVLMALKKRLDPFGVFIIAAVTAVGGGTLRDILIGQTPVTWMTDLNYPLVIGMAVALGVALRRNLSHLRKPLLLFDAIGLGIFTIIGISKGIEAHLHPVISLALGTMTGVFGGVIRDILCNHIPIIFKKEIYASACIAGGAVYLLLQLTGFGHTIIDIITVLIVITIRMLAVYYKLQLPS